MAPELSIVIPVFGCARQLNELYERLLAAIRPLTDDFELVLVDDASPDSAWPRLVGPQIAAVTEPESVTPDGTLFVRVATSSWMNELQLMTPDIMARVNAGRGPGRITTIRWLLSR